MTEDYCLRFTPTARCALTDRLPEAVAAAVFEVVQAPLMNNPHRVGRRLLPPMDDRHSARRGTYRVVYRIDESQRVVTVVDIDHRGAGRVAAQVRVAHTA